MSSNDAGYIHYVTVLRTVKHGRIVGQIGEDLSGLVTSFYGSPLGYLPWHEDGYCGLIVRPAETTVVRDELLPTAIRTEQKVVDWVLEMRQMPQRDLW